MIVPLTPLNFRRQAVHLFPNQTCVVDGELRYDYRRFDERVNRLANGLRQIGLQRGEREELTKGGTGKILKGVLREPYWQGYDRRVH